MRAFLKQLLLTLTIVVHTFSLGLLWFMNERPVVRVAAQPITVEEQSIPDAISGVPVRIVVPSLAIDLHVLPGEYDQANDSWTLTGYNAHFATITVPANNQQGNTFIYGHNNPRVFGPLKRIQPGAEVMLIADNGNQFIYSLESKRTVIPEDVTLFNYHGPPVLTIQTCTGAWHEKRELFQFKFVQAIESDAAKDAKQSERRAEIMRTISQPVSDLASANSPKVLP